MTQGIRVLFPKGRQTNKDQFGSDPDTTTVSKKLTLFPVSLHRSTKDRFRRSLPKRVLETRARGMPTSRGTSIFPGPDSKQDVSPSVSVGRPALLTEQTSLASNMPQPLLQWAADLLERCPIPCRDSWRRRPVKPITSSPLLSSPLTIAHRSHVCPQKSPSLVRPLPPSALNKSPDNIWLSPAILTNSQQPFSCSTGVDSSAWTQPQRPRDWW